MKEIDLEKVFMFLEPGNVAMLSTAFGGKFNVMTFSWHMVLDFTGRFACVIGPWDYTYEALVKTKECVVSVPTVELIKKVVNIGSCSGNEIDKFKKFSLTPLPAREVKAPLIGECIANIECRVSDHIKRHDIFVLDAVAAWGNPNVKDKRKFHAVGNGTFYADGEHIDLKDMMLKKPDVGDPQF